MYEIWTDGACLGNPGPGGWAFVMLRYGRLQMELSNYNEHTTNNTMEYQAIFEGLRKTPEKSRIRIVSDSRLCINSLSSWWKNWELNGWLTRQKEPVKNREVIEKIVHLQRRRSVSYHWVKGHGSARWNIHADRLACAAARGRAYRRVHDVMSLS